MKLHFELTLVVRKENITHGPSGGIIFDTQSIDAIQATNLTSLLSQFQIVIANVHRRIVEDIKTELKIPFDDDIPF